MTLFLLDDDQIIRKLAESIREKRLQLDMTQAELAKRANVSLPTVKKFESGSPPSFKTVVSIMRALGELARVELMMPVISESPREIFEREAKSLKKRKRASRERK